MVQMTSFLPQMTSFLRRVGTKNSEPPKKDGSQTSAFTGTPVYESWTSAFTNRSSASSARGGVLSDDPQARTDSGNHWNGQQQKNQELRGSSDYFGLQGDEGQPDVGEIDPTDANTWKQVLDDNTVLIIKQLPFDSMPGAKRGPILNSMAIPITIIIDHQGWNVTLPTGIRWDSGEAPDLTPIRGRHMVSILMTQIGLGEDAVIDFYGIAAIPNMTYPEAPEPDSPKRNGQEP